MIKMIKIMVVRVHRLLVRGVLGSRASRKRMMNMSFDWTGTRGMDATAMSKIIQMGTN